jgi:PKHD-type hydroxylase
MTILVHVPKLLSEAQLDAIERQLASGDAPWVDGRVTAGHQNAAVKRNQQLDEGSALARELGSLVLAELERNALFVSTVLPYRVYPPMFNRFAEGMQFGTHVDGAIRMLRATGQKLRTDLSATLFLTAPASYDGGELVIDSDFGSQSIKLAAGDLIVYPATMLHRVNPVTRGQRLASVFWVQSLVRDDLRRSQLFELDRTIQQLTRTGADAESLVRLAAHYHALLRAWAET